jgi:hypothetical protein
MKGIAVLRVVPAWRDEPNCRKAKAIAKMTKERQSKTRSTKRAPWLPPMSFNSLNQL